MNQKLSPELQQKAAELQKLMGESPKTESNWAKWLPIVFFLGMIAVYIAIMMFAPDWLKFLATGWVLARIVWVNRDKIMSRFKK